ncbi:hypothetical protein DICPUDRAFT_81190 [Dictyostelium purpureum]|uniref:Sulfotransferase domain-containing protein n=1 Tax=Dictyostelium purpureum TaxID=5786 RepID=F0ZSR8_DICPU|nr:uncharacterized protein DICPUDRAFT_81190 [Dictyostelium purpureum]EGC32992.1 hypothetical protein DICPUDRAFT_81190 [Dictyostelium purpureum]|eukprot:XP_003290462.1 hypothetical protein DICPUDRAFT_81190 [Dictyostelium purpureum]
MNIKSLKKSLFIIFIIVFLILLISSNLNITFKDSNNDIKSFENINSNKENNIIIQDEINNDNNNIDNKNIVNSNNNVLKSSDKSTNKNTININNEFIFDNSNKNNNINNNNESNESNESIQSKKSEDFNRFGESNGNSKSSEDSEKSLNKNNSNDFRSKINSNNERGEDNESEESNENSNTLYKEQATRVYITKEEAERRKREKIERLNYNNNMTVIESAMLSKFSIEECRNEIKYLIKNDITQPTIASIKQMPGYPGPREPYYDYDEYLDTEWKEQPENNTLLLPKPHIFIHMPKTGGTSLLKVFRKNNKSFKFYHGTIHPTYPELQHITRKSTLFGHFRFGLHKYFNDIPKLSLPSDAEEPYFNPYSYLTMLRDPVERTISHYYFLKESISHPLHKETLNRTLLEWTAVSPTSNNEFCRRMVGIDRNVETPIDFEQLCIHRLKYTFKYIGIMERFDESIVLLSHKLGYTKLLFPNENVGKIRATHTKETLTKEERTLIERLNTADIKAYKIALEIFEKEIDLVGRDFFNNEVTQLKNIYIKENGPVETLYINDKRSKKNKLSNIKKEPVIYITGNGNDIVTNSKDSNNNNGGNLNTNNNNNNEVNNDGGNLNIVNSNSNSLSGNGGNINNNFSDSNNKNNNNDGGNLEN